MSTKNLRLVVIAVIGLLIVHQSVAIVMGLFGAIWGLASAVVVVGITAFSSHMARVGGKGSKWFILPTILFTGLPLIYMLWSSFFAELDWIEGIVAFSPFVIGFALPLALLFLLYFELKKREEKEEQGYEPRA